jgi:hypothetical protein
MMACGDEPWKRRLISADDRRRSSLDVSDGCRMLVSADVSVALIGGMSESVSFWSQCVGKSGQSDNNQCRYQDDINTGGRFDNERIRFIKRNGLTLLVLAGVSDSAMSTGKRDGYSKGDGSKERGSWKLLLRNSNRIGYAMITPRYANSQQAISMV